MGLYIPYYLYDGPSQVKQGVGEKECLLVSRLKIIKSGVNDDWAQAEGGAIANW